MKTIRFTAGFLAAALICSATYSDEPSDVRAKQAAVAPREPFQFEQTIDWVPTTRGAHASFQVPAGKRLVIENFTASVEVPGNQQVISAFVVTVAGGQTSGHSVQIPKMGTFDPDVDSNGQSNIPDNDISIYGGGQEIRLYADPGTAVDLVIFRNDNQCPPSPCGATSMSVSGYLIDAASPSLAP